MSATLNPKAAAFKLAGRPRSNAMLNGTTEGMMEQHATTMAQDPVIATTPMPTEQLVSRPKRKRRNRRKMRVEIPALLPVISDEGHQTPPATTRPDLNAPDIDHIMSLDNLALNASVPPPPSHWPQQAPQNYSFDRARFAEEHVMGLSRQLDYRHREYIALSEAYLAVKQELNMLRNWTSGGQIPITPGNDEAINDEAILELGPVIGTSSQTED
ncbi:hypothetical protein IFR05_001260 [Cadophora sp. M221]|nr:hypothetical protein IFR05_001260 [Cadophora sp. M221]